MKHLQILIQKINLTVFLVKQKGWRDDIEKNKDLKIKKTKKVKLKSTEIKNDSSAVNKYISVNIVYKINNDNT